MAKLEKKVNDLAAKAGNIATWFTNLTSDFLENGDFISRGIGMSNSYNDILFMIQSLGHEPVSLLGKDYVFIYDNVRRNFLQGTQVANPNYNIPKFTFYKEKPTIRFADVDNDPLNLKDKWFPNIKITPTMAGDGTEAFYAESFDGLTNNKSIRSHIPNEGIAHGGVASFGNLSTRDLLRKTNENFRHGKYETLVARFHTNAEQSKATNDLTQTANTKKYGLSHGRNLLKLTPSNENSYDNPYCRVWTYHHQYDRMEKTIRPFIEGVESQEELESMERVGDYETVGFRTLDSEKYDIDGGSKRLDKYGSLNLRTGFVNIAPTAKIKDYFDGKEDDANNKAVSMKRCMFSIENLAWKTEGVMSKDFEAYGLSPEQKGPLGGRIMWFPPYDLTFSEESRVNWNGNDFIGRGEKIYTYTNTERTGNLSFTLLIDHPSIIDYWNGHERNGMKNQGMTLAPGNSGGVDRIDNQENTLLRFFAGCEVLTAKPQRYGFETEAEEEKTTSVTVSTQAVTAEEHNPKEQGTLYCMLYFPNNYSGYNDKHKYGGENEGDNGGGVRPIEYLVNGIGAQKYIKEDTPNIFESVDLPTFINESISTMIYSGTVVDNTAECEKEKNECSEACNENGVVTQWNQIPSGTIHGGYEMASGTSGSVTITTNCLESSKTVVERSYACRGLKGNEKGQYITNSKGKVRYAVRKGDVFYQLSKIVGSEALTSSQANEGTLSGDYGTWYRKRWYYRIDNGEYDYSNDRVQRKFSYVDGNTAESGSCYALNHSGYAAALKYKGDFGIEDSENQKLISFTDMFYALEGTNNGCIKKEEVVSEDNCNLVKYILENGDKYDIELEFRGYASPAGNSKNNEELAEHRAIVLRDWMQGKKFPGKMGDPIAVPPPKSIPDLGRVSSLESKLWRSASVKIKYSLKSITTAQETPTVANTDKVTIKDGKITQNSSVSVANDYTLQPLSGIDGHRLLEQKRNIEARNAIRVVKESQDSEVGGYDNVSSKPSSSSNEGKKLVKRYDNEGEFFELLDKKSPFLHNLITEKVKYFDPAYHSISPEGFNARLTFLHQCTRQGSTTENSHFETTSAYNMAFGRPPVCVLRLGDFFNTKILINNLSIQYENVQWDLNPEGIGVMPMFAKISLSFAFIGGSDIAGPIARLQNAVSFNYYANTSVYDNRADRVEYNPNKTGEEIKYKMFTYPNKAKKSVITVDLNGQEQTISSNEINREDE